MKQLVWLFILFLFLPVIAEAGDLEKIGDKLVVHAGEKQYRSRSSTKPLQLASVDGVVAEQFKVGNELFVVVERDAQKYLLRTNDGLGYTTIKGLIDEPVIEYTNNTGLVVRVTGAIKFYENNEFKSITEPVTHSNLQQYYYQNPTHLYLDVQPGTVAVYSYGLGWVNLGQLSCDSIAIVNSSLPTILCNGQLTQFSIGNGFRQLTTKELVLLTSTDQLSVFTSSTDIDLVVILTRNELLELTLPLVEPISVANAFATRIFLGIADQYYELAYEQVTPEIFAAPAPGGELIGVSGNSWAYFQSNEQSWLTTGVGIWQPVVTAAPYNRALKLNNGVALWRYDGADVQFSTDSLNFSLRNGSWARSAKIKTLVEHNQETFLLLLNSSQAPNVYRTVSLASWIRITLPTKPTYQLPIRDARQAIPGTLLELSGIISAGQGVVSVETLYLQDQTGGIQIFLSKTKGELTGVQGKLATITGELSTSQTKRVIIEAPDDAIIGENGVVNAKPVSISDAQYHLGELIKLDGTVLTTEEDSFTLSDQLVSIKTHLLESKKVLELKDTVKISAIADWNSASEAVETWALPSTLVVDQPVVPPTPTQSSPHASSSKKANKTAVSSTQLPVTVAAATKKVTPIGADLVGSDDTGVAQTTSLPSLALVVFSSIGLLAISRGRRFQKLVSHLG